MRIDRDTAEEILATLLRNKSRSLLTAFGVFWGIFMLVSLVGGGNGWQDTMKYNFDGFATNSCFIATNRTGEAYKGFRKGRYWRLENRDIENIRKSVAGIDVITASVAGWGKTAVHADKKYSCAVKGLYPEYDAIERQDLLYGRFINEIDIRDRRKVCVLGKEVYKNLFPKGGNPCGDVIRIDSVYFSIVGVNYADGNMNINGNDQQAVFMPLSLVQQIYNRGESIDMLCVTGKPGVTMSDITDRMRMVVAKAHDVSPKDEKGVMVFNTEMMFSMVDNMFRGINMLIWLVGIGTLLAGAIGVSNIMMVTVRERTVEIGIRRAIGATPRDILSQIMQESILLTSVAGMSGILFVVLVLQGLEMANTTDGITSAHFQIDFWTAIGAVVLLSVLGMLAGLAPALRAMHIKPVDAMRDE